MESFVKRCLIPFLVLAVVVVGEVASADDELTTFIVHVHPHEDHEVATAEEKKTWYTSYLPEHGRLVHAYHHVATGFAARLTRRELNEVSSLMPGFVAAIPEEIYVPLTTHTPEFLGLLTNGSAYGSDRGAGVIIGVVDTGVFPFHPSFSDAGMPPPPARWKGRCDFVNASACNNKLIGARSFVTTKPTINGTAGSTEPFDDGGHGTHTASTAAGSAVAGAHVLGQAAGVATGMAPRAHVAVYKVCNATACLGSDVLAAVEAAVADGCDVVSLSLGAASRPFYVDAVAVAALGAVEKGVFVSAAAGNSGPNATSLSNEAPWVLTVAASTMDRAIRSTVQLGNGAAFHGESAYQPTNVSSSSSSSFYPLVYARAALCGPGSLDGADVRGKIVICQLGSGPGRNITRVMKGQVVRDAGGAGMVLVNSFPIGYTTLAEAHVLPASHVDHAASVAIRSYMSSTAKPVARIVFGGTVLGTSPAPVMAGFSSRGPGLQDPSILKPDVTGPGVNVLAAWPTQVGPPLDDGVPRGGPTFNIISGTSMSTPHLSGIAAAIKSVHPTWSPAAIKSAIMTTADPTDRSSGGGGPLLDEQHAPADWFAAGAGHVSPEKAADPGLVYDIDPRDYVGYLCGLYNSSQNVSVVARTRVDCSAVAAVHGSALNYPSISVVFPRRWNTSRAVVVRRTARNVGTKVPATYAVTVDMPAGGDVAVDVSPRELVFTEVGQEQSFDVAVTARRSGTGARKVVQGALRWVSGRYTVRSPISVSFD
ncbi:hypothetical protein PR202_ga07317 [Eleusine coracana subsp. coracana]|uniref:Uncharacterized protein n=1 Tax=Eleusine coracana subsp. coracana TaxID=191504 RepID=A0AAV5C0G6_ELECO|nr:hypothetical protein QOZ80_2AG0110600 [Eleusine coracana subsp. coracana]GJM90984.1 hypothetical protein PR202_ga07317 [Eleusine coracana subsp. coracana]